MKHSLNMSWESRLSNNANLLLFDMQDNNRKQIYLGAEEYIVSALDSQHEGMVLVANFVLPAAETASGPDAVFLQPGQGLGHSCIPLQVRGGVPML